MSGFASRHRVLVVVLAVAGVLSLGAAAVGVVAYCSFAGCTWRAEPFEPDGERATAARSAATAQVSALADRLAAGHEVLADATADGCTSGQNNWKRKDTYSHECSVLDSRLVLVTSERDAVADGLTAADAALAQAGCRPAWERSGLDRVRDEYWNQQNPQVQEHGAAGLPEATYTCAGGLEVAVTPSSAGARASEPPVSAAPVFFDDVLHEDWYTPADAATLERSGAALALAVTARSTYYRTRF